MTAVVGYLAILRKQSAPESPQAEMLAAAQEQAGRVTRVVEELRSFADQERTTQGQRFSLEKPLRAALALYQHRFRAAGIRVTTRIEAPLPEAQGDPVQLQQVVSHLLDNAVNAMPGGGELDVSLGSIDGRRAPAPDRRHRQGDPGHPPRADLRSVLHHQGRPGPHRPGALGVAQHRGGAPRQDRGRQHGGGRGGGDGAPAGRLRGAPGMTGGTMETETEGGGTGGGGTCGGSSTPSC